MSKAEKWEGHVDKGAIAEGDRHIKWTGAGKLIRQKGQERGKRKDKNFKH